MKQVDEMFYSNYMSSGMSFKMIIFK